MLQKSLGKNKASKPQNPNDNIPTDNSNFSQFNKNMLNQNLINQNINMTNTESNFMFNPKVKMVFNPLNPNNSNTNNNIYNMNNYGINFNNINNKIPNKLMNPNVIPHCRNGNIPNNMNCINNNFNNNPLINMSNLQMNNMQFNNNVSVNNNMPIQNNNCNYTPQQNMMNIQSNIQGLLMSKEFLMKNNQGNLTNINNIIKKNINLNSPNFMNMPNMNMSMNNINMHINGTPTSVQSTFTPKQAPIKKRKENPFDCFREYDHPSKKREQLDEVHNRINLENVK